MRGGRAAEIVALLILAAGTWLGFATSGLPSVVPASAPPSAFSAERAMHDLQVIAATPHAVGSAAHDKVRDYLVDRLRALGADDVHIQSATGFNTLDGPLAATVANIVARKRGAGSGPAVLLSAHYDAVPRSFGAGDDGVGVAAILETLRALGNGPPLDHDLIITFVDAEEDGLLGAEAFVHLHPWAKDAGVVLNFDGRGNAGPVYMFQTSTGNTPLINAMARVDDARTNSLTGEVYRHLPSDTDLSIWLHAGWPVAALNFAHVGGYTHYHTPSDNLASLDPRVLQQMGDYALSLVRTFGHVDLHALETTDAIYFNAPLVGVVHYPAAWALMLAIDSLALVVLLVGLGFHGRVMTLRGVGRGAVALVITLIVPAVVTLAAWRLIRWIHPDYREILQGDPYNSLWYLLAVSAFTVAIAVEAQRRFERRSDRAHDAPAPIAAAAALDLAVAPLLLWGVLGLVVAIKLPGASYLFAWPLFAAAMCGSWWRRAVRRDRMPPVWLAVLAIPAVVLWFPLVKALEVGLTAETLPLSALLLALPLSLLSLPLFLAGELRRPVAIAATVIAVLALVRAEFTAEFNADRRRPDSLAYVADADSSRAWWVSFDRKPDSWTAIALGANPERREFHAFGLTHDGGMLMATTARDPVVPASPVGVLANDSTADGRRIHLHIAHSGVGGEFSLFADSGAIVREMIINGRPLIDGVNDRYSAHYHTGTDGRIVSYYGVPEEGVDLQFSIAKSANLRIVTGVEGLPPGPAGAVPSRPAEFMSKPFIPTDMTLTRWTIQL